MPSRPPRACRCGRLVAAGKRCPSCSPSWSNRPASWEGGSTRRWRHIRAAQLAAHPLCQAPACNRLAEHVDHVTPLSAGGERYDPANLQSLCREHHADKTAGEANAARYPRKDSPP